MTSVTAQFLATNNGRSFKIESGYLKISKFSEITQYLDEEAKLRVTLDNIDRTDTRVQFYTDAFVETTTTYDFLIYESFPPTYEFQNGFRYKIQFDIIEYKSEVGGTGPLGATGPTGSSGQIGATGPTGSSGQIGATGPTGSSGQIGATGNDGNSSALCFNYIVDSTTTPPVVSGHVRLDDFTNVENATVIYLSETDSNSNDIAALIQVIANVTSTSKGTIKLSRTTPNSNTFVLYNITALADVGAYWNLTVTKIGGDSGTIFTDAETIDVCLSITGDKGTSPDYHATAGFILTNSYTLTINTQGVPELYEPPLVDAIVGQFGTDFDNYVNLGQMDYIAATSKIYLLSLNVKVQTANPTTHDLVKFEILLDGSPVNGGLAEATGYIDNTYPTNVVISLLGTGLTAGNYLGMRVTNMTSDNDLTFYFPTQLGGFAYVQL